MHVGFPCDFGAFLGLAYLIPVLDSPETPHEKRRAANHVKYEQSDARRDHCRVPFQFQPESHWTGQGEHASLDASDRELGGPKEPLLVRGNLSTCPSGDRDPGEALESRSSCLWILVPGCAPAIPWFFLDETNCPLNTKHFQRSSRNYPARL